ncbi:MAG TPA: MFS transporter [Mycobacteriales bacterium]|nr:MFS transporter [Mycobacteriales bacterium]
MPLPRLRSSYVSEFRLILNRRRVRWIVISSVIARLPKGIVPLATVLLLQHVTGSLSAAGAAAALVAVGDAVTTPVQGRLIDRYGPGPVLLPTAATHAAAVAALLVLTHSGAATAWLVITAGAAGVGLPPVSGCMKAMWADLVPEHRLTSAYGLESLVQQLFFLAGPLIVAGVVLVSGPPAALIASAVLVTSGTAGFVALAGPVRPTARAAHRPGAWRVRTVRILTLSTLLQSVTFGLLPVGLVAFASAAGRAGWAGVVQAMLTAGGLVGTFVAAGRPGYARLVTGFAAALTPVALCAVGSTTLGLAGAGLGLVAAGCFLTPIARLGYVLTAAATAARTEAFAWLSTGQAIGNAAGASLAGVLADRLGPALTLGTAPVVVLAAALLAGRIDR